LKVVVVVVVVVVGGGGGGGAAAAAAAAAVICHSSFYWKPVIYGGLLHNSYYFRWRNWIIRGIFTWVMICGFGTVILLGPMYIVLLVCLLWVICGLCVCV